ncbi:MAG TPA: gluconate 2-dehydrogenase subunit 3 family protein [Steroidobacteraceae bacterium]|nr:gluconate 2-dehydrogenase subunit 3 family protein [Steroidobacteraceae bacterium]
MNRGLATDQDSPEMLERRQILRRAAWLLGGAISAPAALAVLQGCSAKQQPGEAPAPRLLDVPALALVAEIAETMIPKTDTAGAKEAGVAAFIDLALDGLYPVEDQRRFKAGLAEFDAAARASGTPFLEQDAPARARFVKQALEAALAGEREPRPFILVFRELALLGYFTSKVGITENMEYVPVPTAYHGCVPLSQMSKHVYWE